jgi:flagellar biosynthetic protein FliQ
MDSSQVFTYGQQGLIMLLTVSAPMLIVILGSCAGHGFQAATQINEATLSFVPKLLAAVAVQVAGPWMMSRYRLPAQHAAGDPLPRDDHLTEAQLLQDHALWPFLRVWRCSRRCP